MPTHAQRQQEFRGPYLGVPRREARLLLCSDVSLLLCGVSLTGALLLKGRPQTLR